MMASASEDTSTMRARLGGARAADPETRDFRKP